MATHGPHGATALMVLIVVAATGLGAARCGKSVVTEPIAWESDVDAALAQARREHKPTVIYFGAAWDCAAKELEHVTFADPEVLYLMRRDFVAVHVDTTDDEVRTEQQLAERFRVVGDPTVLILAPDGTELARVNEYVEPDPFAELLARASGSTRPRALALFRTPVSRRGPIW